MKGKPIEEWKPKNRVELDTYRKRLVEIISASSVSFLFGSSFKKEEILTVDL
jgi:translation initiation factor 3 subunit J